jgi:5-methylcytosine-specific restriction endonuclease McrA
MAKCPECEQPMQARYDGYFVCRECHEEFYAPKVYAYWREKNSPTPKPITEAKKITTSAYFTPKQRYQIFERDGFKCVKCGRSAADGVKLHADHIYPKSRGGMATLDNGQTLCDECNIGKGARVPETHPTPLAPDRLQRRRAAVNPLQSS